MFFLLVASEDDEPLNSDPLASLKETQPSPTPIDHPPAQLSLHALSGHPVSATLRVKGNIWGHEVVILVDGGSTHNFVHNLLAHFLHLATQLIPCLAVMVGNDTEIAYDMVCRDVAILIQGHEFNLDLYVIALGGADLVLGVA